MERTTKHRYLHAPLQNAPAVHQSNHAPGDADATTAGTFTMRILPLSTGTPKAHKKDANVVVA